MRCLSLAQTWIKRGGTSVFLGRIESVHLRFRFRTEGIVFINLVSSSGSLKDAEETLSWSRRTGCSWVVLDGYHFSLLYQDKLHERLQRFLYIDDLAIQNRYPSDILLNPNSFAKRSLYPKNNMPRKLLLGSTYALLRREFFQFSRRRKKKANQKKIRLLITMGGSDPANITIEAMKAASHLHPKEVSVIVLIGGLNSNKARIKDLAQHNPRLFKIIYAANNMPRILNKVDLALTAGGSTCLELAFMQIPFISIAIAPNQEPGLRDLNRKKATLYLGPIRSLSVQMMKEALERLLYSSTLRRSMSGQGRKLVGRQGPEKVINSLKLPAITVRSASLSDCRSIWRIANNPSVRKMSFETDPISWLSHRKWYSDSLVRFAFYVITEGKKVAGYVRYKRESPQEVTVSIALADSFRGRGIGKTALLLSQAALFKNKRITKIHAIVKKKNHASLYAFLSCGYILRDDGKIKGSETFHLTYEHNADV